MLARVALSLLFAGSALAGRQPANLDVNPAEAEQFLCSSECQMGIQRAQARDALNTGSEFDYDFYETAYNMSGSRPGDVLKLQAMRPGTYPNLRSGMSIWRFQYTTVDLDGTLVPATGFIAFPYGPPPPGGFNRGDDLRGDDAGGIAARATDYRKKRRGSKDGKFGLIAFSHGTLGVFQGCAPSNGPKLFDYDSWQPLITRGYAVIATDYAGLGNNATQHKYCSYNAHATDVYYSVVAARKLFGHVLTREWMGVGHSQGGGTAWKLAESEYVAEDRSYLGTVALAPATFIVDMLLKGMGGVDHPDYLPYVPLGAHRADNSYQETLLSETLRKRMQLADRLQLCNNGIKSLTADLRGSLEKLVSLRGIKHDMPSLLKWQNSVAPALGARSPAPVLVLQGLKDNSVLAPTTARAVKSSCQKGGNEVHLRLYPGADHGALLEASAPEWLGWIDDRFAAAARNGGELPPTERGEYGSRCTLRTRQAFQMDQVYLPAEDDFETKGTSLEHEADG